jgi:hypothetical protein
MAKFIISTTQYDGNITVQTEFFDETTGGKKLVGTLKPNDKKELLLRDELGDVLASFHPSFAYGAVVAFSVHYFKNK